MSGTTKKIQKIRTFQSDIVSARGVVPESPTPVTSTVHPPSVDLPPVLNERRPFPAPTTTLPPPAQRPVVAATPVAPSKTAMPAATLQTKVDSELNVVADVTKQTSTKTATPTLIKATSMTIPMAEPGRAMEAIGDNSTRGTIITDRKRGRFKLLPAMWQALTQWFEDAEHKLQKRAEKKRLAIPTVRSADERKVTIQKAAAVSALSPKDDYARLAKNLPPELGRGAAVPQPVVTITKKAAAPIPTWSHFDGMEPRNVPTTAVIDTTPEVPITPTPVTPVIPVLAIKPVAMATEAPVTEMPTTVSISEDGKLTENEKFVAVEPVTVDIGRGASAAAKKAPALQRHNFRWLFYVGVVTTAVVAAVSGIGIVNWLLGEKTDTDVSVSTTTNLPTDFVTPVPQVPPTKLPLTRTRSEWYMAVSQVTGGNIISIVPTVDIGGIESQATTEDILAMLALRIEPALTRSIKELVFMKSMGKPVIILRVNSYDSSFGGLLLSERMLSAELEPLFGSVVFATYKSGVGTVSPEFVDELAGNHDVRILKDEMENERLVYGFINQNTVIIAPDKDTFTSTASLLR